MGITGMFDEVRLGSYASAAQRDAHETTNLNVLALDNVAPRPRPRAGSAGAAGRRGGCAASPARPLRGRRDPPTTLSATCRVRLTPAAGYSGMLYAMVSFKSITGDKAVAFVGRVE